MPIVSENVSNALNEMKNTLDERPKLLRMFNKCLTNTLETTTELLDDGTTFVFTGDIPAMWLRDSAAQVSQYISLCAGDGVLQRVIEGLLRRQAMYICIDPYANAFNKESNGSGHQSDDTTQSPWVWERKYEIDSLCYPVRLAYKYWKSTGKTAVFDDAFRDALYTILKVWRVEQRHTESSPYQFARSDCPATDTLRNKSGMPVNYTGMTWSGFRPSDDACTFNYLIPSNMFAVVVLGYMGEIAEAVYGDTALAASAHSLREEIDFGIKTYGVYYHPVFGKIYAYETDGFGNYNLMDDANIPSLLSIPYLGYTDDSDPIYANTRRFILSEYNDYYYQGTYGAGIGSPHTPDRYIWHISLVMQALTSRDNDEIAEILRVLETTDADTDYMHESFFADDPTAFTRPWFAWANSLFAELILTLVSTADGPSPDVFEIKNEE